MRKLLTLLVGGLLLAVAACQTVDTPRKKYASAVATYTASLQFVTGLAQAGKLKLSDAEKVEHIRLHVAGALNSAERILNDPRLDQGGALFYIEKATVLIGELLAIEQEYRRQLGIQKTMHQPPDILRYGWTYAA